MAPTGAAEIVFDHVTKRYPGRERAAVDDLSLTIPAGDICILVGPSGAGKTTAMKMVNRLIDYDEGDIRIDGTSIRDQDVTQLRGVARTLDRNKAELDRALQVLPIKLEKVGRTAIYGSWFNFYLCHFQGKIKLPGLTVPVAYNTGSERCDLG